MKCANCEADALYIHQITLEVFTPFCLKHLPRFLEPLRKAGNLKTTETFEREKATAHDVLKPSTPEIVAEEPKEEPTPIKKPTKKSKPKDASDS